LLHLGDDPIRGLLMRRGPGYAGAEVELRLHVAERRVRVERGLRAGEAGRDFFAAGYGHQGCEEDRNNHSHWDSRESIEWSYGLRKIRETRETRASRVSGGAR